MRTHSLDHACPMKLSFGNKICLVSEFLSFVRSEVILHASRCYLCSPVRSIFANTENAVRAVGLRSTLVLHVPHMRNISQIANPVVAWVPVDVVDHSGRPNPVYMQPCKSVRPVNPSSYTNFQIPAVIVSSDISDMDVGCKPCQPRKTATLWVVVKQFAQALCGKRKIIFSHDTVPSLIGQRPARVISTGGLRYFITRACSWIAEITKCLHLVASKATGVCMPAKHCSVLNPFGALTPFNAL